MQHKLARQQKSSANRRKTQVRRARIARKKRALLGDWRRQTTHRLAALPHRVVAVEDLRLRNMTAAPKPKVNPVASVPGQPAHLPNGAAAKAGLNRALLAVGLGELCELLAYKARREGKAFLKVSARFSSQECSECTHTSPDNRPTQAEFHCRACGFQTHADYNASVVQRKRAHVLLQFHRPMGATGRKTLAKARLTARRSRKPPPQRDSVGGR